MILPQIPRVLLHPKDLYYAGIPPDIAKALGILSLFSVRIWNQVLSRRNAIGLGFDEELGFDDRIAREIEGEDKVLTS